MRSRKSTPLLRYIGQRVRVLRLQAGKTAQELAIQSGTIPVQIMTFEAGDGTLSMNHLLYIAHALGVSLGDILRGASAYSRVRVWSLQEEFLPNIR